MTGTVSYVLPQILKAWIHNHGAQLRHKAACLLEKAKVAQGLKCLPVDGDFLLQVV